MSRRLATGGRLIDRSRSLRFTFDGARLSGHPGDTLASALLANGRLLMGRSFKYHRPRGPVAAGPEEPNALMAVGEGGRLEPNQRATVQELHAGLVARSQNCWPSLSFDIGAVNSALARLLPAGFYYKTFKWPQAFWKHVYEPLIRQSAGLGPVPMARDPDSYEHMNVHVDVLVAGGGIAGLRAAEAAAAGGGEVLLLEQAPVWGGRTPVDAAEVEGVASAEWVAAAVARLAALPNVRMLARTQLAGLYDHGWALGLERREDHVARPEGPRQRLWKIRAGRVVMATGAIERPLAFAGNDIPGVMLASAVRDYLANWAVTPGDRVVVVTTCDDAYRTALALHAAGVAVPAILDARDAPEGPLPAAARAAGLRVLAGTGIGKVTGGWQVEGVTTAAVTGTDGAGGEAIPCDAVAMSGGWSPAVHLWSQCGGRLAWDAGRALFRPDPDRPPTGADGAAMVSATGAATGDLTLAEILGGRSDEGAMRPVWVMPEGAPGPLRAKMFLDFQNDVKVSDVELAAQEGYESVEHAKRYTTLGMATDQGKLSGINGLAILAAARGAPIPAVGTTTFRPPWTPVALGAIAGEARGPLFQPVRRTPLHARHAALGAAWEPVGQWRRPLAYPRAGESVHDAAQREAAAVREGVGLLDASTLGKILVQGRDAGLFLDRIYTGMMSTLPAGRCRYGLVCNDNGFLIDDGVAVRLGDDAWLCHTTTGGAERIHAHMEDWLQTEWPGLDVRILNLTEQYAQIAVAGPEARRVLDLLGGMDLSPEALPFMAWAEGRLGGLAARVFRISFSGELSFEVAVRSGDGPALWDALVAAGQGFGITPYGTEAMHVLRAEKGFVMIGEETDGTVIPQDLGLGWAVSRKKADFIGKRAQERAHMTHPLRWKLVGLETLDGSVLPVSALALGEGETANGQRATQGRVTSTYRSPALGRGIALGLVRNGPDRMGEVLEFSNLDGPPVRARIVSPVFLDPEGRRQDG